MLKKQMKILFFIIVFITTCPVFSASKNNPYLDAQCAINKHQYKLAYDILLPLSEKGDVSAMKMFAELYVNSNQDNSYYDTEKALYWGQKAAETGDPYAQYSFALVIRRIADKKYSGSYEKMGEQVKWAIEWYRRAAEQGHAYAQMRLGDHNYMGAYIKLNPERAYMWYTLAAHRSTPRQDNGYSGLFFAKRKLYDMDNDPYFSAENRKNALQMVDQWEKNHPRAAKTWSHFVAGPGELPHEEMKKRDCFVK